MAVSMISLRCLPLGTFQSGDGRIPTQTQDLFVGCFYLLLADLGWVNTSPEPQPPRRWCINSQCQAVLNCE